MELQFIELDQQAFSRGQTYGSVDGSYRVVLSSPSSQIFTLILGIAASTIVTLLFAMDKWGSFPTSYIIPAIFWTMTLGISGWEALTLWRHPLATESSD